MKYGIFRPKKSFSYYFIFSILSAIFLFTLIIIALYNWRVTSQEYLGDVIVRDVEKLAFILERIDKDCKILSFDYQKNRINFLTVTSFVSSEVGSLNLKYPEKWQGPYLDDNPTCQEKEYLVVRTKYGYYVTPGEGVSLPNGRVVGKDIIIDENADISSMIKDDKQLQFKNKPLAEKLNISTSIIDRWTQLPLERI